MFTDNIHLFNAISSWKTFTWQLFFTIAAIKKSKKEREGGRKEGREKRKPKTKTKLIY